MGKCLSKKNKKFLSKKEMIDSVTKKPESENISFINSSDFFTMKKSIRKFHQNNKKSSEKTYYNSDEKNIQYREIFSSLALRMLKNKKKSKNYSLKKIKRIENIKKGDYISLYKIINKKNIIMVEKEILKCSKYKEIIENIKNKENELKQLKNKYLLSNYGCIETSQILYNYIEYMDLGSLRDLLNTYFKNGINENLVIHYCRQILTGLEYLHQREYAHKNLKPENILINTKTEVKLSDFYLNNKYLKDKNDFDYFYMAPEFFSKQFYDKDLRFFDIWSFGCIVYEMITGKILFDCNNVVKKIFEFKENIIWEKKVSLLAQDFVSCCLKINPLERKNVSVLLKHPFLVEKNVFKNSQIDQKSENSSFLNQTWDLSEADSDSEYFQDDLFSSRKKNTNENSKVEKIIISLQKNNFEEKTKKHIDSTMKGNFRKQKSCIKSLNIQSNYNLSYIKKKDISDNLLSQKKKFQKKIPKKILKKRDVTNFNIISWVNKNKKSVSILSLKVDPNNGISCFDESKVINKAEIRNSNFKNVSNLIKKNLLLIKKKQMIDHFYQKMKI